MSPIDGGGPKEKFFFPCKIFDEFFFFAFLLLSFEKLILYILSCAASGGPNVKRVQSQGLHSLNSPECQIFYYADTERTLDQKSF